MADFGHLYRARAGHNRRDEPFLVAATAFLVNHVPSAARALAALFWETPEPPVWCTVEDTLFDAASGASAGRTDIVAPLSAWWEDPNSRDRGEAGQPCKQ